MTGKKRTSDSSLAEPEARIIASNEPDDENPELTEEWFAKAVPHIGGKPVTMDEFRKAWAARTGRPKSANPKKAVNLRLDADVVAHFKAGGPGWQTRVNDALRKAAKLPAAPASRAAAVRATAKKT